MDDTLTLWQILFGPQYIVRLNHIDANGTILQKGVPTEFRTFYFANRFRTRLQQDNRWHTSDRYPVAVIEGI